MNAQYSNTDAPTKPQLVHVSYTKCVTEDPDGHLSAGENEDPDAVYFGVQALASFMVPIGGGSFHMIEVRSAGLWGIGVDPDKGIADPYLDEVYADELAGLKGELETLGQAITRGEMIEQA